MTKKTVESTNRLKLQFLRRNDLFYVGAIGTLNWNINGKISGSVEFEVFNYGIKLNHQFVIFAFTPCIAGEYRTWLICSNCNRRIAIIYEVDGYFACQHCHNLNYASQHRWTPYRCLGNSQSIRTRLGGSPDITLPFPEKPDSMYQYQYEKLRDRARKAEYEFYRLTGLGVMK